MSYTRSLTSLGSRYTALWVGQTVSQFGTYVAFLTLPFLVVYIQKQSGSTSILDVAFTYALENIPILLVGLLGGVLLDRWPLRPVMIAADLVRASAFFYLAANLDGYGVTTVFVVAFLVGSMTTMFDGAMYSMIPSIVPDHELARANAYISASQQANFALGPLAAGIMAVTTGSPALGLIINGLTFVVSAISLNWVGRVGHHHSSRADRQGFLTEAANGIRYIMTESRLRVVTFASAIPNFVVGFVEATFVILAAVVFETENDAQIGILFAALGVGGVIGALVAPRVVARIGLGKTLTIGMSITGVCLLAVMFTTFGVATLGLQVGWMFGVSLVNVPLATIRQHYSSEAMLGRVVTASRAIGWATLPLGAMIGGWLGDSENAYPVVARTFPLLLLGTAIWLYTTVIWKDSFGPTVRANSDLNVPAETNP
ncbi:MAG TPA: MFS transporter [Acidimicrobiia bacterium]